MIFRNAGIPMQCSMVFHTAAYLIYGLFREERICFSVSGKYPHEFGNYQYIGYFR